MNKKDIPSIIDLVVDGAKAIIKSSQGSFEDYIHKRALELDSYIKLQESEESLTYVAGEVQISIDDKEYAPLKMLCDEIFGETNYEKTDYIQVRYPDKTLKSDMKYHKENRRCVDF